ncbi:MAG TPA: phosphoglycerate kinase, partial [Legionellaceae bacterium]|nr:phosphoglycerate kinase [Legionellaceae bacterium]
MSIISMQDIDLKSKRVLIREDLNVPIKDGMITSDQRLQAAIPTLQKALSAGAGVIILSHLGRPIEGKIDSKLSLQPVAHYLSAQLNHPVRFETDYLQGVNLKPGEI